jgi:hypothetical protein
MGLARNPLEIVVDDEVDSEVQSGSRAKARWFLMF